MTEGNPAFTRMMAIGGLRRDLEKDYRRIGRTREEPERSQIQYDIRCEIDDYDLLALEIESEAGCLYGAHPAQVAYSEAAFDLRYRVRRRKQAELRASKRKK